ncbi:hypothetical protein [Corynebacterium accolens]|uniref:hypothetical protein n=1 Tax=Corynebacterium accolens TaxID=38284 RepID=UPI00255163D7|nr:hypothetical protein [Corynebacterium accolens]MDK8469242.1 hypothetical protein [Corynebacterium accolens]MDK8592617.1 hypothetical protein [Corynebacterium accolens]
MISKRLRFIAPLAIAALIAPAAQARDIPPMPQAYPITNLYKSCSAAGDNAEREWRFAETGRRYLSDGTLQFKNSTDQEVPYTAEVETGTNHEIDANSKAKLPSGWDTTAKSDIGLKLANGWRDKETFGPVKLKPGESFRVEYGVVEKDFISMFVGCNDDRLENIPGANVIRGKGPAERYAFAYIIKADGSVSDLAMEIPSRSGSTNSKPIEGNYTAVSGPSLEKIADPDKDEIVQPAAEPQRDAAWPKEGDTCEAKDKSWYPLDITAVQPTFRKPGYSTDFLNWSHGDYEFAPVTDFVVGAQHDPYTNWRGNRGDIPQGWLESVGAVKRAYMPVGTELKHVHLEPGERVRVEYGTTMTRINYREVHCGKSGKYDLTSDYKQTTAPSGFWAEATITSKDGSTRAVDVTPDEYRDLPVPTQTIY